MLDDPATVDDVLDGLSISDWHKPWFVTFFRQGCLHLQGMVPHCPRYPYCRAPFVEWYRDKSIVMGDDEAARVYRTSHAHPIDLKCHADECNETLTSATLARGAYHAQMLPIKGEILRTLARWRANYGESTDVTDGQSSSSHLTY